LATANLPSAYRLPTEYFGTDQLTTLQILLVKHLIIKKWTWKADSTTPTYLWV